MCGAAPVGVDVERVRPRPRALALARSRLHPKEADALAAVPDAERDEAFARLWTAKEAVLKARGTGLVGGLDTFAVVEGRVEADDGPWTLAAFDPEPGVVGTVAVRAAGPVHLAGLPSSDG